ncbi:MAG: hypothetical protein QM769_11230 [Pseudoxanthomonas sp.]
MGAKKPRPTAKFPKRMLAARLGPASTLKSLSVPVLAPAAPLGSGTSDCVRL